MTPSPASPSGRKRPLWLPLFAALALALPTVAGGQSLESRAYQSARSGYEAALDARDLARALYEEALTEVNEARDAGDEDRHERALAVFQQRAQELEERDRLVTQAADRLEQARQAYLVAVEDRLAELFERLPLIPETSPEHRRMLEEIDTLNQQANDLADPVPIQDDPFPEITIDPEDGPLEIRAKADLLDRQAESTERILTDIDTQIRTYERRLRHARMAQDFRTDLRRFDDTRSPVGSADPGPADSLGPGGGGQLTDLLDNLRRLQSRMEERRDAARARARDFRARIGGVS